jgi:hypothetical protein
MGRYEVEYVATVTITVAVDAEDESDASEVGWSPAAEFLETIAGDGADVRAIAHSDDLREVLVRAVSKD